jgi:hypothetical protein
VSITKNYADRTTTFGCDECGVTFEADSLDFHEAYEEFKDNGGIARLSGGDWEHRCEYCR